MLGLLLPVSLVVLSSLLSSVRGVSCPQGQWQCSSMTADYNYANCVSGVCQCRTSQGFVQDNTTSNLCNCPSGRSVYWNGGSPYCVNLADAGANVAQDARETLMMSKVVQLYTSIVWPGPASIVSDLKAGRNNSFFDLFAIDAVGRIDPLGEFETRTGCAEYFVGPVWDGTTRIVGAQVEKVISSKNYVAINVITFFAAFASPTETVPYRTYNFTQAGFVTFNDNNEIQKMDMVNKNVGWNLGDLFPNTPSNKYIVCYYIMDPSLAGCNSTTDPAGYYTDFNDCLSFINAIDFGTWDNQRTNSTLCRFYHATLARIDPVTHCPHTGKTGGGKCTFHDPKDYYKVFY